jgi:ribosome maturation factor RimP
LTKAADRIREAVTGIATSICDEKGISLFDVEVNKGGGNTVIQVFLDAPEGVSVDNCASVSRELATQLDVLDPVSGPYVLEVGSPGLERSIRNLDDAAAAIGKKIKVNTEPLDGRKKFTGVLNEVRGSSLVLEQDKENFEIPWSSVKKANLVYES